MSFPETTRASYRCREPECDTPFRQNTPVNVPVTVYVRFLKSLRCPKCDGNKLSLGLNLSQAENQALCIEGTIEQRARHWHENGEVGTSSLTIFHHFMGSPLTNPSVPADLSDLRRCLFLLDHSPEWQSRMNELAIVEGWHRIASQWGTLAAQFRSEAPDLRGPAPKTEQLLHSLTCAMETAHV